MKKKKIIVIATLLLMGILIIRLGIYFGSTTRVLNTDILNLREKGKIIVGASLPFDPMLYYAPSGEMIGFEADMIKEIAKELGLNVEIVDVSWEDLFSNLQNKRFDLIMSGITITSDRMEDMIFSDPYLNAGQVMIVRSDNSDITGPEQLKGKKVSVQEGTTCEEAALKYVEKEDVMAYPKLPIALEHFLNGESDSMIVDYPIAVVIVKNNPNLKIIHGQLTAEYYGLATWKGNDALMEKVNTVIKLLKRDGRLEEIEKRWLH